MILGRQIGRLSEAAALKMLDHYPRVAFIHIPKSAGSSVAEALHAIYPMPFRSARFQCRFSVPHSKLAHDLIGVERMIFLESVLTNALADPFMRFVSGHVYAHPRLVEHFREWKFVTVLREPIARFISGYVFGRYKADDFGKIRTEFVDFVDSPRGKRSANLTTRYLSGRTDAEVDRDPDDAIAVALDNLERFFSVGFVDDLENWALNLGRALGHKIRIPRKNRSPKPEIYAEIERSPALRQRIEDLCAIDRRFYAAAQERFRHRPTRSEADAVARPVLRDIGLAQTLTAP